MAVTGSGAISMKGLHNEKANNDFYNSSDPSGPVSMYDLVNGGNSKGSAVSYAATNTSGDYEPNTDTPHAFNEWYNYDHDFVAGAPSIPTISFTQPSDSTTNLVLNWAMEGNNTRVYFYIGAGTSLIYINGNSYKSSAGTANYSDTDHTFLGYPVYGTTVGPNDTFQLRARGYYNSQFSAYSSVITGYTLPEVPTSLSTSNVTTTGMDVSWTAPTGGVNSSNGYRLYFGTDSTATNNSTTDTGNTSNSFSGLVPNQRYYMAIQAKNDGGHFGAASSTVDDYTKAGIPTSLTATSITRTSMVLGWTAVGIAPTTYTIYFGTNPSSSGGSGNSSITNINGSNTSYSKTGLSGNTKYYFFIQAIANTNSDISSVSGVFITLPDVPAGLSFAYNTDPGSTNGTATVSWNAISGNNTAETFNIHYGESNTFGNASNTTVTGQTGTSATLTGIAQDVEINWWIAAVNATGTGDYSNRQQGGFSPIYAPTGLSETSITTSAMTLNWSHTSPQPQEYIIEFGTNGTKGQNSTTSVQGNNNSKTMSGLTAGVTYYWWIHAFGSDDQQGVWSSRQTQATAVTSTWDAEADFTIQRNISSGAYTGITKTVGITNPSGVTSIGLTDVNGGVTFGDLEVRGSYDSMPPAIGTEFPFGESHTGYISTGNSSNLPQPSTSSATLNLRFKFTPEANAGQDIIRVTLTCNSTTRTFDVTIVSHNPNKSDRRLKTNIEFIKNSPSGIPIYQFRFKESVGVTGLFEGVMAQDILEMGIDNVISTDDNGWYLVDYDKIDVEPKQIVDN